MVLWENERSKRLSIASASFLEVCWPLRCLDSLLEWGRIIGVSLWAVALVEIDKFFRRRKQNRLT